MLGLPIEDVTLIKQREVTVAVRFRGGATKTLTLPRPLTAQQLRATHEPGRRQIDALLDEYTDAQVARILNERGLRTGAVSIQWTRYSTKLKSLKERLLEAGILTKRESSAPAPSATLAAVAPDPGRLDQSSRAVRHRVSSS